jgi:2-keto-4-pentenoate hydratase/2-oxohepta-3-ene-1,7-dioic acid hydratase in catechol pathway
MPPTIPTPSKIICVGLNYFDHAKEQGIEPPSQPLLFAKWPSSLIGPADPIQLPAISSSVDYEAELAVIIGTRAKMVPVADALDIVAGYAPLNDVSARDLQFADGQFTRSKSLDTFCPIGEVVPAEDVQDPQSLRIRAILNGEVMQDSNTCEMIFSIEMLIAHITQAITLEPGDVIATGTPAGVGVFRNPPRFLQPGDEVTIEIETVGRLTNRVLSLFERG